MNRYALSFLQGPLGLAADTADLPSARNGRVELHQSRHADQSIGNPHR
ncbi:MAG: hypothetical protein MK103_01185 [Planctomycetes bacterium]|nr:hypothetical protein [Planctomycetota bacterium]